MFAYLLIFLGHTNCIMIYHIFFSILVWAISTEEAYVAGRILNRIAGVLMEGSVHEHRDNSSATSFLSTDASYADMSLSSCLEIEIPSKSTQEVCMHGFM